MLQTAALDPTCSNTNGAVFEFDSDDATEYFIYVYPRFTGEEGTFALQVTDYIYPVNDYCSGSLPLVIGGDPIIASTVNAT